MTPGGGIVDGDAHLEKVRERVERDDAIARRRHLEVPAGDAPPAAIERAPTAQQMSRYTP
jgi:hypothetical protein